MVERRYVLFVSMLKNNVCLASAEVTTMVTAILRILTKLGKTVGKKFKNYIIDRLASLGFWQGYALQHVFPFQCKHNLSCSAQ